MRDTAPDFKTYPARALRALGLLLADGAPTVVARAVSRKTPIYFIYLEWSCNFRNFGFKKMMGIFFD